MTNEIIDWDVMVFVEPALSGVEETSLVSFEHNGNRIEFREHRDNKTKLSILLKSEHGKFENTINALLNYFLGRFELLEDSCPHSYELEKIKNLKTGEIRWCKEVRVFRRISVDDEPYITSIDNFVKSSENSKIVKAIAFFHYAKRATYLEHAFLSSSNAFKYLIDDIGKQDRTRCSGSVAVVKLFYEQVIEDEESKKYWEENITWAHDEIDKIRYENKQVSESEMERITKLFKEFLDMYIRYTNKQMNEK
jgi:hypothetical protein